MLPNVTKILFATDMNDNQRGVLSYAIDLARRFDAQLTLMHVLEPMGQFTHAIVEDHVSADTLARIHDEGITRVSKRMQQEIEACIRDEFGGDQALAQRIKVQVEEGRPAELILKQANASDVDLIVLGGHGHSTIGEILLGSTAHRITQRSQVPVLLIPVG